MKPEVYYSQEYSFCERLVIDFEHGVWVERSWLGTKKAVLMTKNKPEGISFMFLETGNQLWFSAAFLQESKWGGPPAAQGSKTRPPGLSVYRETDVTYTQLHLGVVTSDQRSYSMQCICFRYRNIEKIFIEI